MNCKKIEELIMTSYIDGELDENTKREVEEHLISCADCKALAENLKKAVVEPLEKAAPPELPSELWYKVRERIEAGERMPVFVRLREAVDTVLRLPKPAFALATVAAAVLIIVVLVRFPSGGNHVVDAYFEEQIGFFDYLSGDEEASYLGLEHLDSENGFENNSL